MHPPASFDTSRAKRVKFVTEAGVDLFLMLSLCNYEVKVKVKIYIESSFKCVYICALSVQKNIIVSRGVGYPALS